MNVISVSPQAMSNADWCLVAAISFMSYATLSPKAEYTPSRNF
ncbi:hypothetical protein PC116_g19658 [Phytophthora cactorum]|nr:hypothetical protein PC128_g18258 [Phytophthora cactorum]KAG4232100.1 hypothetical protein PC116_g19658 [Phytophthora cactorum]